MNLGTPDLLKLLAGLLLLALGIWRYRRGPVAGDVRYGSQTAVLLLALGGLLIAWVVGGLLNPAGSPS
jgi:hypothetical protein